MSDKPKISAQKKARLFFAYLLSGLGGLGIALQNFMAVGQLINSLSNGVLALTAGGQALLHSLGILLGGLCSGFMNLLFNIPLLKGFVKRVSELRFGSRLKGWDKLSKGQKFLYWAGIGIFITSGVMLGLTALAFGPIGWLATVGIVAGVLVALISTVQELETWLERFDEKKKKDNKEANEALDQANLLENEITLENENNALIAANDAAIIKLSLFQKFINWKNSLTKAKVLAGIITIGNVIALSLLMAMGVASFLTGVGVAALPALIVGLVIAFTVGAFTEYYFYSKFISNFCEKFEKTWNKFKTQTKWPVFGFITTSMNAITVGVLTYVGITLIAAAIVAAGVAVPPFGVIVAIAVLAGLFAATASFMLGIKFWTKNMPKEPKVAANDSDNDESDKGLSSTAALTLEMEEDEEPVLVATNPALQAIFDETTIPKPTDEPLAPPNQLHFAGFSLMGQTGKTEQNSDYSTVSFGHE